MDYSKLLLKTNLISMNAGIAGVSVLAPRASFAFAAALLVPCTNLTPPTLRALPKNALPYCNWR